MWDHKKWAWWLVPWPFLVGLSRIYIFVHYPSDVLFGMINGIIWALIGLLLAKAVYGLIEKKRQIS